VILQTVLLQTKKNNEISRTKINTGVFCLILVFWIRVNNEYTWHGSISRH